MMSNTSGYRDSNNYKSDTNIENVSAESGENDTNNVI